MELFAPTRTWIDKDQNGNSYHHSTNNYNTRVDQLDNFIDNWHAIDK